MKPNVWVGNFGEYAIPDDVISKAEELNLWFRPLSDQRTKGFKYLYEWGKERDLAESGKVINAD